MTEQDRWRRDFVRRLKAAMEDQGLDVYGLEAATGIKYQTLIGYLNGAVPRQFESVELLEAAVGRPLLRERAEDAFDRGYAAGEFSALAEMASAIATRAREASKRLSPTTEAAAEDAARQLAAKGKKVASKAKGPAAPDSGHTRRERSGAASGRR